MNAKKHGKVTMALAMIGGLAALSIAYAAISTQLNINSGDKSEKVEASAVMFDDTNDACKGYGVSAIATDSSGNSLKPTQVTGEIIKAKENDVAKCGTVDVSSGTKENDTVTINGTVLRDYGAFAVYQLTILNKGSTAVKLTSNPNSNAVTNFKGGTDPEIQKNITIGVYSDSDCTEKVVANTDGLTNAKGSYIPAKSDSGNGSTTWYVKVSHKPFGGETEGGPTDIEVSEENSSIRTTSDITSGSFGFTITPVWENV